MSYFEHNDRKGRNARLRVILNREERKRRIRAAEDFSITLYMPKHELRSRLSEARVYNLGVR